MTIKFSNLKKAARLPASPPQDYSPEAIELMRAIKRRERAVGRSVKRPAEVFAILLGIGYQRDDEMDIQDRAREFISTVRKHLQAQNRRSPSYDEILSAMRQLGYSRTETSIS